MSPAARRASWHRASCTAAAERRQRLAAEAEAAIIAAAERDLAVPARVRGDASGGGVVSGASFPRIVRFLETTDSPGSSCPHCGADGRFILTFVVDDGRTLGAMRGCAKLFPVSQVAVEELRLRTKQSEYRKRGWTSLGRRDAEALAAIESFYAGARDERSALAIVRGAKAANIAGRRRCAVVSR